MRRPTVASSVVLAVSLLLAGCGGSKSAGNSGVGKYGLSSDQYHYVIKESATGGKMDYEEYIKDRPFLILIGSVAYNHHNAAQFLWGQGVKKMGVTSVSDALALYREIHGEELSDPESRAITNGYNHKE